MPTLKRIIFFTLIVLGIAITISYYRFELERIDDLRETIKRSEEVLAQKKESVRNYREKVAFYHTKEGVEHLAREQYNLVGKGERVVLLKSGDKPIEEENPELEDFTTE